MINRDLDHQRQHQEKKGRGKNTRGEI